MAEGKTIAEKIIDLAADFTALRNLYNKVAAENASMYSNFQQIYAELGLGDDSKDINTETILSTIKKLKKNQKGLADKIKKPNLPKKKGKK